MNPDTIPISPEVLLAVGASVAAWLLGSAWAAARRRRVLRREQRAAFVEGRRPDQGRARRAAAERVQNLRPLARPRFSGLAEQLERWGIEAEPHQFIAVELIVGVIGGLAGGALFGPLGAAGGLALAALIPVHLLRRRRAARISAINDQLPDLLQVVAGGVQAGQSFLQALDHAAEELGEPLASELRIVLRETELGVAIEEALDDLRHRVPDADLSLVVDAVLIQRRVGGNLAEVLNNIAHTIRERIRIRGEVKALTGQARLSGWVLSALPIFLAAVLTLLNPQYMSTLFFTTAGRVMLGGALTSELIGMLLIRRIANVKV